MFAIRLLIQYVRKIKSSCVWFSKINKMLFKFFHQLFCYFNVFNEIIYTFFLSIEIFFNYDVVRNNSKSVYNWCWECKKKFIKRMTWKNKSSDLWKRLVFCESWKIQPTRLNFYKKKSLNQWIQDPWSAVSF